MSGFADTASGNRVALPLGAVSSLALHAGIAAAVLWAVTPADRPPQEVPQAEMVVEAWRVDRAEAAEARPDTEAAREEAAEAGQAASGAVPLGRAAAQAPDIERPAAAAPGAEPARAAAPQPAAAVAARPDPVAARPAAIAAQAPAVVAAAPRTAEAAPVAAVRAEPVSAALPAAIAAAAPPRVAAAPAELPAEPAGPAGLSPEPADAARAEALPAAMAEPGSVAAAPAEPETERAAAALPATDPADAAEPAHDPAPAAALPAERRRATLAPLGPDGRLDPKSLEALAALTGAADPGSQAAELQDGIRGLLGDIPCARLQMVFDPDTGEIVLRGNIPDPALAELIAAGLEERIGTGIPVTTDLRYLPAPQCEALAGLDAVGLPQSTDQFTNARIIGPDAFAVERDFANGQPLDLDLGGADYDAYVYFDYYMADGQVLHFIPSAEIPLSRIPAFGRSDALRARGGRGPLGLVVGPPYGREIAVAFASSVPLYEGLRPMVEPAGAYLDFLREKVAEARAAHADFKGEWVYFLITTHE